MIQVGDLKLYSVSGGRMKLDGGTMFGVVPKLLWQRYMPADDDNRIDQDTNCLLIQSDDEWILVDTGFGSKLSDKRRRQMNIEAGNHLFDGLAALGVSPQDISTVILTHLHFDHAGGCTVFNDVGEQVPAFPNARYVAQQAEWDDAVSDAPELFGAYFKEDLLPIQAQLDLVDSHVQLRHQIRLERVPGHTRGHQIVWLGDNDSEAIYLGDLCPTASHLPTLWTMSYDQYPLTTRREKFRILDQACDRGSIVLFDHDPKIIAATLKPDPRRQFAIDTIVQAAGEPDQRA